MRAIKFRAKSTQNYETSGESIQKDDWITGYYYFCKRRMSGIIITELSAECGGVGSGIVQCEIEVDYKTVGQFTERYDKNDKEIYEGDILRTHKGYLFMIRYKQSEGVWKMYELDGERLFTENRFLCGSSEVRGNIFQNPNLLGGKK